MVIDNLTLDFDNTKKISDFYNQKDKKQETIFQLWKSHADVGPVITPAVYDRNYARVVKDLLETLGKNEKAKYLSIGCGISEIEESMSKDGFRNITCIDIHPEATKITHERGLSAILSTGLAVPIKMESQDVVYMDGCLGHMASNFYPPFNKPFLKPLEGVNRVLKKKGVLVVSDDPAENGSKYQMHPRVKFLRADNITMMKEVENAGFRLEYLSSIFYKRPTIGKVHRRIIIANKK